MLEKVIRELIEAEGPMRLDRYMALCVDHYYRTHDPFADFITAPEASQVFGELIGVWCVTAWRAMGSPAAFNLIELGPGNGTLMSDILRAAKPILPAAHIHLVESSPRLQEIQCGKLSATWHDSLSAVPEGPAILIANEFFDALPIRQFEQREGKWHERVMGLVQGNLQIGLVPTEFKGEGDLVEISPARQSVGAEIAARLSRHPGFALIIDYGHAKSAAGDTLQAVRAHKFVPITESPGVCDITSHVDFEALAGNFLNSAMLSQRDFLHAMGLEQRTAALVAKNPAQRDTLHRAMSRLADEAQMGKLFKVLAAGSPKLALPYPFTEP